MLLNNVAICGFCNYMHTTIVILIESSLSKSFLACVDMCVSERECKAFWKVHVLARY